MEIVIVLLLAAAAVAAVLLPILKRADGAARPAARGRPRFDETELDAEIARYRVAFRAGTVCPHCRYPNPPASRFCAECGRPLAGAPGAGVEE